MTTNNLTDAQIVARVLKGDQAPYGLLVERYQPAVFNAAYRLLGHIEEAADITQEAFLRAYQALDSYQTNRPLAPWLCRIAINLALSRLKKRRPALPLDEETGYDPPDPSAEPQAALLHAEQQQMLRQAILALPPDQRAVIELRHFQDQSYEEIAAGLGISLTNVKSRLFRARQQLRQILQKELC